MLSHTPNLNLSEICLTSNPILKTAYSPYEPSSMLLRSVVLKDPTARVQLSDVGHVSDKKEVAKSLGKLSYRQNISCAKLGWIVSCCNKRLLVVSLMISRE